ISQLKNWVEACRNAWCGNSSTTIQGVSGIYRTAPISLSLFSRTYSKVLLSLDWLTGSRYDTGCTRSVQRLPSLLPTYRAAPLPARFENCSINLDVIFTCRY